MSKVYNRALTPPSSHLSKRVSSHASSSKSNYDYPPKIYRNSDKYEGAVVFDHAKYDKSYKNDRFDKFEKTNYKSNSSGKNAAEYDHYSSKSIAKDEKFDKNENSIRETALTYKAKRSVYRSDSYSDRDLYLTKYSHDSFSKPYASGTGKDEIKHSSRPTDSKQYSPYNSTKTAGALQSSKYGSSNKYSSAFQDSFDSYADSRQSKLSRENIKDYSSKEASSESYSNYQRYVVGNTVIYGAPGQYPKGSAISPKSKSRRSSFTPPPTYSRFTPPRYRDADNKLSRRSPYSNRSPRQPPSPPPLHNYRQSSPQRYFKRNFTPPPDRDKCFDAGKGRNGRDIESHNKFTSSHDFADDRKPPSSFPKPTGSPKPLLSIPLSLNNVPRESRANLRETLGMGFFDNVKGRRFDGRIGQGALARKRPLSPRGDRKLRRPDDLRLWIESRKTQGTKVNNSLRPKRDSNATNHRSRLLEARKRLLDKGNRRSNLPVKRTMKGRQQPLPQRSGNNDLRRSRERTRKVYRGSNVDKKRLPPRVVSDVERKRARSGDGERRRNYSSDVGGGGSTTRSNRIIKRPRVISNANSLPVRNKIMRRRSPLRSPPPAQRQKRDRNSERSRSRQREKKLSSKLQKIRKRSKSRERIHKKDKSNKETRSD